MTCLSTNEVVGFIHGDLDPEQQEAVERHLDACPACRYLVVELARAETPDAEDLEQAREEEALAPTDPQGYSAVTDEEVETAQEPAGTAEAAGRRVLAEPEGRYQIRSELRRGGQARILVAYDTFLGREVALKELIEDDGDDADSENDTADDELQSRDDESVLRRFLREARITGRLTHPSIVHMYEMGCRADGTLYYTMPLVRGRTLAEEILRTPNASTRLHLLSHFEDLCQGIAYAHSQGVLHRDIKPENVMIGEFGETVLLDWGLAKTTRLPADAEARGTLNRADEALTAAGMSVGTPAYMSPEQAAGQLGEVDERSDVWGLGTVLYVLITGKPPFEGRTAGDLVERVLTARFVPLLRRVRHAPPELVAIVGKCLKRDRRHRYQSVKELQADLRAYRSGGRVQAYRYSAWERMRSYASRHRRLLLLVAAALVGMAATLVVMSREYRGEARTRSRLQAELRQLRQNSQRVGTSRYRAAVELTRAHLSRANALHRQRRFLLVRLYAAAALAANPARRGGASRDPTAQHLREEALQRLASIRGGRVEGLLRRWPALPTAHRLAVSPDGGQVAYYGRDGALWLRSLGNGSSRRFAPAAAGGASALAFSGDGRRLAIGGQDAVDLRDVTTGKITGRIPVQQGPVLAIAFSPGSRQLVVTEPRRVAIWDLHASPALKREVKVAAVGVGFTATGAGLRIATRTRGLVVEALRGRRPAQTLLDGRTFGAITAAAIPGTAPRLWAVAGARGLLRISTIPHSLAQAGGVTDLRFSADGRLLASAGRNATVRLWDGTLPQPVEVLELPRVVHSAVFALKDQRLLTASEDGVLREWRLRPTAGNNPLRAGTHPPVPQTLRTANPLRLLREAERAAGWTLQAHLTHTGSQSK